MAKFEVDIPAGALIPKMTRKQITAYVHAILPHAQIEKDNEDQWVVYTAVKVKD